MENGKWVNNHKVTCSECLHVKIFVHYEDGMAFRYDEKCKLGYETNYRIPYKNEWDCKHYEKWTIPKALKKKIKELL